MTKKKVNKRISFTRDKCPSCGSNMKESSGKLGFPVNGEDILVPDMSFLKCSNCDEIVLRLDESRKLREKAIDLYRNKYHLLSGEEIRSLRERLGLTQADLADLLRLGQNTLSRWESGRNVQASAMDVLLRLIRDVPGTLEYLRKLAA
jgi:HTH-type transcriptional regulator/antitoxin MqsA